MYLSASIIHFFFFNDTATTEIYTLSLHDALPICKFLDAIQLPLEIQRSLKGAGLRVLTETITSPTLDRKSTRLNSSHTVISYAVFCLKKKKKKKAQHHIKLKTTNNTTYIHQATRT